jgi:hypothetical protein
MNKKRKVNTLCVLVFQQIQDLFLTFFLVHVWYYNADFLNENYFFNINTSKSSKNQFNIFYRKNRLY